MPHRQRSSHLLRTPEPHYGLQGTIIALLWDIKGEVGGITARLEGMEADVRQLKRRKPPKPERWELTKALLPFLPGILALALAVAGKASWHEAVTTLANSPH